MSALEGERSRLVHAAEHRRALLHAAALLEGDDRSQGGIDLLTSAAKALQGLEGFPEAEELGARAVSLRIELQDIAHSASALAESAEEDPERLAELDQTLSEFERLKAKHRCADQTALQAFGVQLQETLDRSADREAAVERARNAERIASDQLAAAGDALASTRHRAALELVEHTRTRLNGLKLERAHLEFVFTPGRTPDAWGTEDVEMLFSANPGTPPLPLVQVASGGERSRLMLALKAASGAFALAPTIVLDEIDTGVSGDVAARITHLPQVASRAPQHIQIFKTADVPPVTQLHVLRGRERVEALAAMLSGSQITEASIANAEALLAELG
jgi:DNA repair protein RecN (Recombination protein N)